MRLQAELKIQRERNADTTNLLEAAKKEVLEARKRMGGVKVTEEATAMVDQQVQVLETRLDRSLQRFNDVLRRNKTLRDNIDTLRGEREVFDAIYLRLESELQEKKKEMAFIIEVSNTAYEECDNNKNVLANLKHFAAEEMASFAETFRELDELLEEDSRMKEQVRLRLAQLEAQIASKGRDMATTLAPFEDEAPRPFLQEGGHQTGRRHMQKGRDPGSFQVHRLVRAAAGNDGVVGLEFRRHRQLFIEQALRGKTQQADAPAMALQGVGRLGQQGLQTLTLEHGQRQHRQSTTFGHSGRESRRVGHPRHRPLHDGQAQSQRLRKQ